MQKFLHILSIVFYLIAVILFSQGDSAISILALISLVISFSILFLSTEIESVITFLTSKKNIAMPRQQLKLLIIYLLLSIVCAYGALELTSFTLDSNTNVLLLGVCLIPLFALYILVVVFILSFFSIVFDIIVNYESKKND